MPTLNDDRDDDLNDELEPDIDGGEPDEDEPDDLAELSEDELKDELRRTRERLSKASGSSKAKRTRIQKLEADLTAARVARAAPKPKTDGGDKPEPVDVEAIKAAARAELKAESDERVKKVEARGALRAAGIDPARVGKAVGLLSLDDLDVDDDGEVEGLDDAIDDLRREWPELFPKGSGARRRSVAGAKDSDGTGAARTGRKPTATELQVAAALGRPIRR
ncbi:MAG: hypothetical protein ACRCSN_08465 [Dermatophilaceae bacterium]